MPTTNSKSYVDYLTGRLAGEVDIEGGGRTTVWTKDERGNIIPRGGEKIGDGTTTFDAGFMKHTSRNVLDIELVGPTVAWHDGSGGLREGPVYYDGAAWRSLVDGTTPDGADTVVSTTQLAGDAEVQFDQVVNAADIGAGPGSDLTSAIDISQYDNTLIALPDGDYTMSDPGWEVDDLTVGLISASRDRAAVTISPATATATPELFTCGTTETVDSNPAQGLVLSHLTIDSLDNFDASFKLCGGMTHNDLIFRNIEYAGWAGTNGQEIYAGGLADSDGNAVIQNVIDRRPIEYGEYPNDTTISYLVTTFNEGDWLFDDIEIVECGESGIYSGKGQGYVTVRDSYFKNCQTTAVRVTDGEITNCTIIMDDDDLQTDTMIVTDDGGIELSRGIWAFTDEENPSVGPTVEDCDIQVLSAGGIAGIFWDVRVGEGTIRNTRIDYSDNEPAADFNRMRAVLLYPFVDDVSQYGREVTIDGLTITGSGESLSYMIEVRERDGSVIQNSCLELPNADGIQHRGGGNDSLSITVRDSNVNVGGYPIGEQDGGSIIEDNLTFDQSCPDTVDLDSWQQ